MRRLHYIPIEKIDSKNKRFEVNYFADFTRLRESVHRKGILQPLRLKALESEQYVVVSGFRRLACALELGISKLPVIVHETILDDLSLFESTIEENFFTRSFNIIELATILDKLHREFNVVPDKIVDTYMPFLGMKRSVKVLRFYENSLDLEEVIKQYIVQRNIPIHIVADFLRFTPGEQREFTPFLDAFSLSASTLKEFLERSHEIILRDRINLKTFLSEPIFQQCLQEAGQNRVTALEKLRKHLKLRRFPKLMELETRFHELRQKLDLPFEPPNFFEDNHVRLNVSFKDKAELTGWMNKVKTALTQEEMEEMMKML